MTRKVMGPFNRVEGDLEVTLDFDGNQVASARVSSPLYRGFEQILYGKDPRDALVFTPRICGICSVSQSMASARALADLQGLQMPPNGELATNLVLANENIADHLTHFYLFFMPDFAREVYAGEKWYQTTVERFGAQTGKASQQVLPVRAEFMHLMGLLAGKWPHSMAIQPGGSTRPIETQERIRVLATLFSFRRFLETTLFGDTLERIIELDSKEALFSWADEASPESSDLRRFLQLSQSLGLDKLGRGTDRFMSYGAYNFQEESLFLAGLWDGDFKPLKSELISEDLSHSWMSHRAEPKHPFKGITLPDAEAEDGYTWCKAPRLDGRVVEVGALARQQVSGHPLIRDLVAHTGGNVQNRVIARLLEIARVVPEMESWAKELKPKEPFCVDGPIPDEGQGQGLVEAARGSLGHWIKIKRGRIINYQIIAPTTWNFSPRDSQNVPGALEQALVGASQRDGESDPVSVQHIVRSFDPCMVCTVH